MAAEHQPRRRDGHGERHRDRRGTSQGWVRSSLISVGRTEVVNTALVEIDRDPAAACGQNGAPYLKALQDRLFPLTRGALLDLQMRGHVLDRAQELKVEHADTLKHVMTPGIVEGERRHALLDH